MDKVRVSIAGGSGYGGGELLRLLLFHPHVEVLQATSERHAGQPVSRVHPNLRKQTQLQFVALADLQPCDLLFLALPHGEAVRQIDRFITLAPRIVDLSADFRLKRPADYREWYRTEHPRPELLPEFVYGIPELHRDRMRTARFVSSAGCNATAAILGLYPLYKHDLVNGPAIVEVKAGSSEGGNAASEFSHHPERSNCLRSYKPTGHRHSAEVLQELPAGDGRSIHFSATSVDLVRGILATMHVFLKDDLDEREIWKVYRRSYADEPFIRIVKERDGNYRYPEPKLLAGTNFCDIGFERERGSRRLVVMSAIDNLMKGAAGQAVQAFNIMHGFPERTGLQFPGLHPI